MKEISVCSMCNMENVYFDGSIYICPDCGYEISSIEDEQEVSNITKDSNGNELFDGDSVIVTQTLKVKGSTLVVKQGTKVKGIKLTDDTELVDCKVEGQNIVLKTCYLRK